MASKTVSLDALFGAQHDACIGRDTGDGNVGEHIRIALAVGGREHDSKFSMMRSIFGAGL